MTRQRTLALTAAALTAGALTVHAGLIPGVPDLVIDPAAIASLGDILGSNATLVSQSLEELNMAKAQIARFSHMTAQDWLQVGLQSARTATQNLHGETGPWTGLMAGNRSLATPAWKAATTTLTPPQSFSGLPTGSPQLATLASIETMDSHSVTCLEQLAQIRSNAITNESATRGLLEASDTADTAAKQAQIANATAQAALLDQQSARVLQSCQVESSILANKVQRDHLAAATNYEAAVQEHASTDGAGFGSMADAFTRRLP